MFEIDLRGVLKKVHNEAMKILDREIVELLSEWSRHFNNECWSVYCYSVAEYLGGDVLHTGLMDTDTEDVIVAITFNWDGSIEIRDNYEKIVLSLLSCIERNKSPWEIGLEKIIDCATHGDMITEDWIRCETDSDRARRRGDEELDEEDVAYINKLRERRCVEKIKNGTET